MIQNFDGDLSVLLPPHPAATNNVYLLYITNVVGRTPNTSLFTMDCAQMVLLLVMNLLLSWLSVVRLQIRLSATWTMLLYFSVLLLYMVIIWYRIVPFTLINTHNNYLHTDASLNWIISYYKPVWHLPHFIAIKISMHIYILCPTATNTLDLSFFCALLSVLL